MHIRITIVVLEKAISVKYSQCVFLTLVIRHARRGTCAILYCHLCLVRLHHISPHCLTIGTILWKKNYFIQNACFDFLYNCVWNISHSKKNSARSYHEMHVGLHVKYPLLLQDFSGTELPDRFSKKYSNITSHKNPFGRSRAVPCGRKDRQTDRQTDRHDGANSRFSQFCKRA